MNRGLRRSLIAIIFVVGGMIGGTVSAFHIFNSTDAELHIAYTSANPVFGDVTCVIPPREPSGPVSSCIFRGDCMDADTFLKEGTVIKVKQHFLSNTANTPEKEGTYGVCTRGSTCEVKNFYVNEDPDKPGLIIYADTPGQPLR